MTEAAESKTNEFQTTENPRSLLPNIFSGAASLSASQIVRRASRTLFLLLAARKLGPANFGLYIFLLTITEMIAIISGAGFGDYITREVAKSPRLAHPLLVGITELRVLYIFLLILVFIPTLSLLKYPSPVLINATFLLLTLFPRAIVESSQAIVRAVSRFALILWLELLQGMGLLAVGALLLYRNWGLRGLIWAEATSVIACAVVASPIAFRLAPNYGKRVSNRKQRIRDTFAFNLYPLIANTYDRLDVLLLSKMVGNVAVGIYSMPYRAYAALSIFPYALMGTLLPGLARSSWGQDEKNRCSTTMQILFAAALFLIMASMLFANTVIQIVLGSGYSESASVLKILAWATLPMFMNYALNTFLLARGRERLFLRTASVCTVVNIIANLILIPRYSYLAAASVTILTELVLLGQNVALVRRVLGFVPIPRRALQNSFAFGAVLVAAHEGARFVPPFGVAAIALSIFSVYLCAANRISWSSRISDPVCAS